MQENKGGEKNELENISTLEMQAPTGEALVLSWSDNGFEALIQWDSFMPRKSETRSYKIVGKSVAVDIGEPYPDKR